MKNYLFILLNSILLFSCASRENQLKAEGEHLVEQIELYKSDYGGIFKH